MRDTRDLTVSKVRNVLVARTVVISWLSNGELQASAVDGIRDFFVHFVFVQSRGARACREPSSG